MSRTDQAGTASGGMTTVLLVRHAAVDNPGGVLYGRLPRFGLSPRGREEAEQLAAILADRPVAAIYSSPLLRARQTAGAIARYHPGATRHVSALLHEVRSAWQGTPLASFRPGFSTYGNRRADDDESMEAITTRMTHFVERVRRRHPGATVVAVSHGDPITILRVALRGQPLTLPAIRGGDYADHCSLTEIVLAPGGEEVRVRYQLLLAVDGMASADSHAGRLVSGSRE